MLGHFCWDWNERVPLGSIIKTLQKHPGWKVYTTVDHGGTFTEVVIAPDKKTAINMLNDLRLDEEETLYHTKNVVLYRDDL
jgi:predicted NAD/FAD-binding protein